MQRFLFKIMSFDNYDGDTFTLRLDVGFNMTYVGSVRINGVDTPELRGGTPLSKAAGKLAKDEAAAWVQDAMEHRGAYFLSEALEHKSMKVGKYGRPLGDILRYADDESDAVESLTGYLSSERFAVPYHGGSKAAIADAHEKNIAHLDGMGMLAEYMS